MDPLGKQRRTGQGLGVRDRSGVLSLAHGGAKGTCLGKSTPPEGGGEG